MTERMLAREALERKENREKWEFPRLEVRRLVEGSEEFGALAAALLAGDEDFAAFERGGREALLEGFAEGLSARLSALDAAREAPTCGECGSRMRRRGSRRLSPVSLFGRLELKRGYWTCGCSKGGAHPLDAALGVVGRSGVRLTPAAMRALARLCAEMSCARAAELFGEVAGVAATAKRAERCARQVGREIAAAEDAEGESAAATEVLGDAAAETMCWSPDGTGVPVRRGEAGAGRDGGEAKTREAKTMVFHTAEGRDAKTGLPRSDADSARYSAAIDSAESKDTDSEPSAFARRTWLAASLFGFVLAKRKVVVADGAKWIWNVVAELFPGAVEIVDVWHAKERLWEVARAVYGSGTDLCRRWAEQICEALWEGRVDDVLAELRSHAPTHEVAEKCVGHVEGNRHRMNYPRFRAMGLLVGSGMVESACGTLVGERLKRNGMRWSVAGANDIMALRCCIRNKRYDHFWRHRNKQAA